MARHRPELRWTSAAAAVLASLAAVALALPGAPARSAPTPDPALTLTCLQLRRATVPQSPFPSERLVALRLLLDGGLDVAVGDLRAQAAGRPAAPGTAEALHHLRVWRTRAQRVLRQVAAGRQPAAALAAAEPGLTASAAAVAPLVPDADGTPCALAPGHAVLSPAGPLRAALLYEGVLVALGDRSSPARVRAEAPVASRALLRFAAQLSRLRPRFPRLAASGRSLVPSLRAAVLSAGRARPQEVAGAVTRLGGIQPFLMNALSTRDLEPVPVPSPPPGPGEPGVVVPRLRGLPPLEAFGRLCEVGLAGVPHATIVGEQSVESERRMRAALAGARTPEARTRVYRLFQPVTTLGTDPRAGATVSPGARVTLRLGVLQGSAVVLGAACM